MNRSSVHTLVVSVAVSVLMAGCTPSVEETPAEPGKPAAEAAVAAEQRPPDAEAPVAAEQKPPAEEKPPQRPGEEEKSLEEMLQELMKLKNPGIKGQVVIRSHPPGTIRVVGVNDPAVTDISPLRGFPLVALDLRGCRVGRIDALKGMPLVEVYLEENPIEDIGPLQGAPLQKLYLSNTKVKDLGPLRGADQLTELNLLGTKVSDLGPLEKSPLKMLWLTGCPVRDLAPLQNIPTLVSLTAADTKVSDISPLKGHPLQRLHIAGTEVTDLSPLEWMNLTRLVFTPGKITKGIDRARNMRGLREIGPSFEQRMQPSQFWELFDRGKFK